MAPRPDDPDDGVQPTDADVPPSSTDAADELPDHAVRRTASDRPTTRCWAAIVAELGDARRVRRRASSRRTESVPPTGASSEPTSGSSFPVAPWVADRRVVRPAADATPELSGRDWDGTSQIDDAEASIDAEEHFVPPDPGPVLGGDPLLTMAWCAAAGVPIFLLIVLVRRGATLRGARAGGRGAVRASASACCCGGCRTVGTPTTTTPARWSDRRGARGDRHPVVSRARGRPRRPGPRRCPSTPRRSPPPAGGPGRTAARRTPCGPAPSSRSPASRHAAADDDERGVEQRGRRRGALADPPAELGEQLDGERVALLGGLRDLRAGELVGVAAGQLEQPRRALRVDDRRSACASRTSALPEAYCSQQPSWPQPQ